MPVIGKIRRNYMSHRIGLIITFLAKSGQRDKLAKHLLDAAGKYESESGTELFTINLSISDPDAVIVVETYANEGAKAEHERSPAYSAIRIGTDELLAGAPLVNVMVPLGGKGLKVTEKR
jgi:quinol monooxygenase YgiN